MPSIVIARNQTSSQNLVELTKPKTPLYSNGLKLKRIVTDSKSVQQQDKKEKKERRKHKKEKREKSHKHSSKKQLLHPKKTSSESEQLEKSGLTEELCGPQNQLGYLSDGSQNSKKRKREASPPAVESAIKAAPVAGKPLRIRLIFKKPKVESPSLPQDDLVACSTSNAESAQAVICSKVYGSEVNVPSTSEAAIDETKKICEPELNVPSTPEAAIDESKKRKKHKPSKEDRYNTLFDDWTPPSFLCVSAMELDSSSKDDDDWLFGSRTQERLNCKAAVKIDEDVNTSLQRSCDSSWPRAQFLSQVGIYSLPYTVPF